MKIKHLILSVCFALFACGQPQSSTSEAPASQGKKSNNPVLNIVAGSELKDLKSMVEGFGPEIGATVKFTFLGTLESVDNMEKYDMAWLSSDSYAKLLKPDVIKASDKTMYSPVILGVRTEKAKELGWDQKQPSWKDIAKAVGDKKITFAMTNPTTSNTGFSALMGVAAAFANTGDALTLKDLNQKEMSKFFSGVTLISGSSGWLADAFVQDPNVDAMINYESVLIALQNKVGADKTDLTLIYPVEGVVTANYPLLLINKAQQEAYNKLLSKIKSVDVQKKIALTTYRHPVVDLGAAGVDVAKIFPNKDVVVELPFPNSLETVDGILDSYLEDIKVPSRIILVLDVSGSMEQDDRIGSLKQALKSFSNADKSLSGRFAKFRNRDDVYLIPFSSEVQPPMQITFSTADKAKQIAQYQGTVNNLQINGGTAIYSALQSAVDLHIKQSRADKANNTPHYTTVLLLTDGENRDGIDYNEFANFYKQTLEDARPVKFFPILFGDGSKTDMDKIAAISRGKVFDGQKSKLTDIFKEIRGYQ